MLFGLSFDALILVGLAALLVGISKAGFGGGVGIVATPIVALVMPVADAAALMLPVLIGTDVFTVGHYRRSASARDLRLLLPASLIGVVLAAGTFNTFADHERLLESSVGLLALAFVAWKVGASRVTGSLLEAAAPSAAWGGAMGALSGFGSTLAHAGGPPITVYLLPRRLPRQIFVGTTAWFFFVLNLVKLVPYAWLGLLSLERLTLAGLLLPLAWLGTWIGVRLLGRLNERLFTRFVTILLAVTGTQLLLGLDLTSLLR